MQLNVDCMEDPSKNFLPSPGKITKLKIPNMGLTNIRLDIGVDEEMKYLFITIQ